MSILFIAHYTELYGANRSLLLLLDYFRTHHPELNLNVVVPQEGPICSELKRRKIPFEIITFRYSHVTTGAGLFRRVRTVIAFIFGLVRLWRLGAGRSVDLVYSNSSVIAHGLLLAKLLNKKHIWHIREYGLQDYDLVPVWGKKIQHWLYQRSNALVFVSKALKRDMGIRSINDQLQPVIYNGVQIPVSSNRPSLREFPGNEIRICYAGFMSAHKNAMEALDLVLSLNKNGLATRLIVCSDMTQPYAVKFQERVVSKDLSDKVDYLGFVDDLIPILSTCHFLIMPSRSEAMGRVTAEAMAAGVPVIGYRSAGTAELFEHGRSGIFYTEIGAVVQYLKVLTSPEYLTLCDEARKRAEENFSLEKYGKSIMELCYKITGKSP